ncbi:EAL domain-containing protein, partial [Pseudomaricurvus sp.]|uniref:EAL domain-containing protein n=1 Tax=Pseudomaricurvus sp. TaxID=2004510 RepID=UPI003F6D4AE3
FVSAITQNKAQEHVADMVLQLGKRFNFRVVAEGIETEEQRQMLLQKGCELGQGYLFAKPMGFDELLKWLRQN